MSARDYALDYSALDRGWATQGAADYCDSNGHATRRVDGVDTGICPRCLTVTERYNGNGDRIFHGFTAEGEVFGIEVTDTPVADVEDQGYSEWIDLIESEVYVNAEARVHRDFSSQSGVQGFVGSSTGMTNERNGQMPEPIEGQDEARGILAVNPEAEGSAEWHAWSLGYEYAVRTQGVYDYPLSGEWADMPHYAEPYRLAMESILGSFTIDDYYAELESSESAWDDVAAAADAFELGYATYVAGWRI